MKRVLFIFCCAVFSTISIYAQSDYGGITTLKIGSGFTRDFPGLNGYTVLGEISHTLYNRLEGSFALKRMQLSGYPRSASVNEYTKATTIDFAVYYLPVENENHIVRAGIGYSFTFYKIRRSYPLVQGTGTEKTTTWQVQDKKGREKGFNLIGEYQYLFPESSFSLGMRVALYQAYDGVGYIGPFVGVRL